MPFIVDPPLLPCLRFGAPLLGDRSGFGLCPSSLYLPSRLSPALLRSRSGLLGCRLVGLLLVGDEGLGLFGLLGGLDFRTGEEGASAPGMSDGEGGTLLST